MGGPTRLAAAAGGWSDREQLARIAERVDSHSEQLTDHEGRIRAAERRIYLAAGFAAALGGGLGSALTNLLGH